MSRPRACLAGPGVFLADGAAIVATLEDRLRAEPVRFGRAAPS